MMYEHFLIVMNSGASRWCSNTKESQAEEFGYFFSCSLRGIFLSFISVTPKTLSNPDTGRTSLKTESLGSNVPCPSASCRGNFGCNWAYSVFSLAWEQWKSITTLYPVSWGSQIPSQALAKLSWEIHLELLAALLFRDHILAAYELWRTSE